MRNCNSICHSGLLYLVFTLMLPFLHLFPEDSGSVIFILMIRDGFNLNISLVVMLSTGLSTAMLSEFSTREKMKESLILIREKSTRLMHILFPASMVAMLLARPVYPVLFSPEYSRGADIFVVYLLLVIPRLVFPQTIIIGRKRTNIALSTATVTQIINIPLSLALIPRYNVIGVALSTFAVYVLEKIFLIFYVKYKMRIKPIEYIPIKIFTIYSVLISILFILIDHRIIDIK